MRRQVKIKSSANVRHDGSTFRYNSITQHLHLAGESAFPEVQGCLALCTTRIHPPAIPTLRTNQVLTATSSQRWGNSDKEWVSSEMGKAEVEMTPSSDHEVSPVGHLCSGKATPSRDRGQRFKWLSLGVLDYHQERDRWGHPSLEPGSAWTSLPSSLSWWESGTCQDGSWGQRPCDSEVCPEFHVTSQTMM